MKTTKTLAMLVLSVLAMACILAGCAGGGSSTPYITLNTYNSIDKYYYVGEEIALNGMSFNYFANVKDIDKEPTEANVVITTKMISGFDTSVAGEFSFKINYKGASQQLDYYVYDKPDISTSYGFYKCLLLGRNKVAEIKAGQVLVYEYGVDNPDIKTDKPIAPATQIASKVKAGANGSPKIIFTYEQAVYTFTQFVDGVPTFIQKGTAGSNTMLNCTRLG